MAPGVNDAFALIVAAPLYGGEDVLFEDRDFVAHRARGGQAFHFGEEPGGTEGGASDHDGIDAVAVEALACPFGCSDVTVADDGDVHAGVVLDFADKGPVGFAAVHLGAGTAVDGEFGYAAILEALSEIDDEGCSIGEVEGRFIPSEAGFAGDGCMDGVDDGAGDVEHLGDIAEESCSGTLAGYFLDRAAKIDIDEIRVGGLDDACGVCHGLGVATVYLDGHRTLGIGDGELAGCGGDIAHECIGVDELGIDTIGSVALA